MTGSPDRRPPVRRPPDRRPPVLVIDPDAARRNALGQALAAAGYEVVPAAGAAEGLRFAAGLETAVVVAPGDLPEVAEGSLFAATGGGRSIVLLGAPAGGSQLDDRVVVLPAADLGMKELSRQLHLVLVSREVGLEVDPRCEALVGDLAQTPLLELLRGLGESRLSGRLELERGTIHLADGQVTAAAAEPARGRKAFCRLSRLGAGHFRFVPGTPEVEREIGDDLQALIVAAIEDSMGELPDPRTRVRIEIGPEFFACELSPEQKQIVQVAQRGAALQAVLDAVASRDGEVMEELLRLVDDGIAVLEEPAPAVLVVTDSSADLPPHVAREHGIRIVPLKIRFGDKVFRDGVDLEPRRFYELLENDDEHPATEPPARADFAECFGEHLERRDVVSVHLSGKMSDTAKHAGQAARRALVTVAREAARIEVFDSGVVSVGLGCLAVFAARMAARGQSAAAIVARLETIAPRLHELFVVDHLDYLIRGGRIGRAKGMLGKLLGIKPILGVDAGEVVAVDRARGSRAAHHRLIELMAQRVAPGQPTVAAVVHARAPGRADRLRRLVAERFAVSELIATELGPVVGTHVGPGMVGVMAFQPTAEEAPLIAPLAPDE